MQTDHTFGSTLRLELLLTMHKAIKPIKPYAQNVRHLQIQELVRLIRSSPASNLKTHTYKIQFFGPSGPHLARVPLGTTGTGSTCSKVVPVSLPRSPARVWMTP